MSFISNLGQTAMVADSAELIGYEAEEQADVVGDREQARGCRVGILIQVQILI